MDSTYDFHNNISHSDDENQSTEWKWSWNDEYLKWLCGYANMDGGTLYLGVDDDGYVVGLENARELLEILPNKISDKLGIVASIRKFQVYELGENIRYTGKIPDQIRSKVVNRYACGEINSEIIADSRDNEIKKLAKAVEKLEAETPIHINEDGTLDYISITIERYPFAISCDGKYYKRSGSTLHLLDGFELQNFLLERAGKTWDSILVPGVTVEELDKNALNAFRKKAVRNNRMTESEVNVSDELLLKNLKLYDGKYLTRAAILLFHPDPEQFVTGAYVKIAFFAPAGTYGMNTDADIIYHDDIHGPLITQADKVEDLLFTKYFKALLSYDKLQRIETFMLSRKIARELILNPINHKDYARGVPIQISVYDDHIEIFNVGSWPNNLPIDNTLYEKHESVPHNPKIADVFYRSGEIESWGRGFLKIRLECEAINAPLPIVKKSENGVTVNAYGCETYMQIYKGNVQVPGNSVVEDDMVITTEDGMVITTEDGIALVADVQKDVSKEEKAYKEKRNAAYENMLEICSQKLKDREKQKMYPIVDYFATHDEIDRATVEEICHVGTTTAVKYLNKLISLKVIEKLNESITTIYKINMKK